MSNSFPTPEINVGTTQGLAYSFVQGGLYYVNALSGCTGPAILDTLAMG